MHKEILIPDSIKKQMFAHAKSELPNECCGYVTGVNSELKTIYKMTNVDASPVHFGFDPKEQFKVIKDARSREEIPIVVYHSHPESPPRLSNEDLRLLTDPNMVYLIVSLDSLTESMAAYHIIDDRVINVDIKHVKDNN